MRVETVANAALGIGVVVSGAVIAVLGSWPSCRGKWPRRGWTCD